MDQIRKVKSEYAMIAIRVSMVCIFCNLFLCVIKMIGGFAAHSDALVSDAINSAFDVISGIIVIVGARLAAKKSDPEHPYGHERFESVATVILGVVLFVTAVFVGHTAVEDLVSGDYKTREIPGMMSVAAALVSIVTKEILFWYTKGNAEKIDSSSLRAEAWDHRADVIATAGALIGIFASRFGFPAGDLIASLVVCLFIVRTAFLAFREGMSQMVDRSCDDEVLQEIRTCVEEQEGVLGIDLLQVRTFGNRLYVDLEILEDKDATLSKAHEVAENVHDALETQFPVIKHVMIHVNPKETEVSQREDQ